MHYSFPLPDGTTFVVHNLDEFRWLYYNFYGKDEKITSIMDKLASMGGELGSAMKMWQSEMDAYNNNVNPVDAQTSLGLQGITPSSTSETANANATAQFNTQQAQDYATWQMMNGINANVEQLVKNGLSPSSVIQTGAANGNMVAAADSVKGNAAEMKQRAILDKYNQRMSMARSVIGMVGQMASSGIYGSAIGAAKHSASVLAGATAHSALNTLKSYRPELLSQLMKDEAARNTRNSPYGNNY